MSFKIEKDIPLEATMRAVECPYPFSEMSIGDSFFVECTVDTVANERARINNWVRKHRRISGIRGFSVSTRSNANGFRVWRNS